MVLYRFLPVISVVICLTSPLVHDTIRVNDWSLRYVFHLSNRMPLTTPLPPPPASHLRALLWLTNQELDAGNHLDNPEIVKQLTDMDNALALRTVGRILASQGNIADARQVWFSIGDYYSLSRLGDELTQNNRLEEAYITFKTLQQMDADRGTELLLVFLTHTNQTTSAITELQEVLANNPSSLSRIDWLNRLGGILKDEGRWDEAEAVLKQIFLSGSGNESTYIQFGWLVHDRGDGLKAALSAFQEGIRVYPQSAELYYHVGLLMVRERSYAEAARWFQGAIDRNPDKYDWYLAQANTWRYRGDFDRAAQAYRQVIERFPDDAPAYFELAWAYKQLNQAQESLNVLEQTSSMTQPSNPNYFLRAGDIYEWAGHNDLARESYELVLKIDPENLGALQGIERLEMGER